MVVITRSRDWIFDLVNGGDSSLVTSWLKLLCLTSGLAFSCSGLGLQLTHYNSNEEATYHLFPSIPWLMPVTIPLFLAGLIALGLQPSYSLELSLYITFTSLVFIFTILGIYKLKTIDDEIVISIKLNRLQEIPSGIVFFLQVFIIQSHRPCHGGMSLPWFLLLLSLIGILTAVNEKECGSIISCLKILDNWTEPITLALTISSIGLCLPDLFAVAQNYIYGRPCLKKMLMITRARSNISILLGVTCAVMVYLCSMSTLVMISGSSIVLSSTIENLLVLLNIQMSDDELFDDSTLTEDGGFNDSNDNSSSSGLSDSESSCSDISLIVAEYKAKIKIMSGDTGSIESKTKRMLFIYRGLVAVITILGLLLAYSIQYLQLLMGVITSFGLVIFMIIQHCLTSHVKIIDDPQKLEFKVTLSYLLSIILLGGIPKQAWFYITFWSIKGVLIYMIQKNRNMFYKRINVKHNLSIEQSPPIFETMCDSSLQRKMQLNS